MGDLQSFIFNLQIEQKYLPWPPSLNQLGHLCSPTFFNLRQLRHRFGKAVIRSDLLAAVIHGQAPIPWVFCGRFFATQKAQEGVCFSYFLFSGGAPPVFPFGGSTLSGHLPLPPCQPPSPRPARPPRHPRPAAPSPPSVIAAPAVMSTAGRRGSLGSYFGLTGGPSALAIVSFSWNRLVIYPQITVTDTFTFTFKK